MSRRYRARYVGAVVVLGAIMGCASYASVGQDYAAVGKHELAVPYYAQHYRGHADDPQARDDLKRAIDAALKNIDADYDSLTRGRRFDEALGVAIRREQLLDYARSMGLDEFNLDEAGRLVDEALPRAGKLALKRVDDAEGSGVPALELLGLLRTAVALMPDDAEVSSRYRRLRDNLRRNIAIRLRCGLGDRDTCEGFASLISQRFTEVNRELIRIVPPDSQIKNAEMVVHLATRQVDSDWQRKQRGRAACYVQVYNHFKEPMKKGDGSPKAEHVEADFDVYQRSTSASVTATVQIRDLRPGRPDLFNTRKSATKKDSASYYTWRGDERAFDAKSIKGKKKVDNPFHRIKSHGVDQSAPRHSALLLRDAWEGVANSVASAIVSGLEK